VYEVYLYNYGYEKSPVGTFKTLLEAEDAIKVFKRRSVRSEYLSLYIVFVDKNDKKITIHVE